MVYDLTLAVLSPSVVKQGRPTRRKGALERMQFINLDVLLEICTFLHPRDLLSLARTSRAFRRLLIQNTFVWREARLLHEGDMPERPSHLTERQYANLAFGSRCANCGEKALRVNPWRYCRRLCYRCVPQLSDIMKPTPGIEQHVRQCRDWERRAAERRRDEAKRIRLKRSQDIRACLMEWGWQDVINHFGWENIAKHELIRKTQPLAYDNQTRTRNVLIEYMKELDNVKMEQETYTPRRRFFENVWRRYLVQRSSCMTFDVIVPPLGDLCASHPFKKVIETTDPCEPVAEYDLQQCLAAFQEFVCEWRHKVDLELATCCLSDGVKPDIHYFEVTRRLKLASSIFIVDRERSRSPVGHIHAHLMTYPDVLRHESFSKWREDPWPIHRLNGILTHFQNVGIKGRPWSINGQGGHPIVRLFKPAADVIRACGMDPERATPYEMSCSNVRLACASCCDYRMQTTSMTWIEAIRHASRSHFKGGARWVQRPVIDQPKLAKQLQDAEHGIRCLCQRDSGNIMRECEWNKHISEFHSWDEERPPVEYVRRFDVVVKRRDWDVTS